MKFKLKQPTKYMHEILEKEDSGLSDESSNDGNKNTAEKNQE